MFATVGLVLAASLVPLAFGQNPGCIQLIGSDVCPGFSDQYINPSNLASQWPFFSQVTDVASFDAQLANYLSSSDGFAEQKYNEQLGCTNTSSTFVLQYAQTFLCSMYTQISYTAGCYTGTNVIRRMACQQTCLQFATSENYLVNDALSCGTDNLVGDARQGNLTQDFTSCTDWTTLSSNNTATCVIGQNNEPNCGFRDSRTQLCHFCNPQSGALVNSCCGEANVNLEGCGYTLSAAQVEDLPSGVAAATATGPTQATSSSGTREESQDGGGGLSGGAIAGIVIGSVLGAIKLIALWWFCCVRRKNKGGHTLAEEYGIIPAGKNHSHTSDTDSSHSFGSPNFKEKGDAQEILRSPNSSAGGVIGMRGGRMSLESSAYTSSSGEARNLVSSYRDHYSSTNIVPGSTVTAIYTYNANLPDELHLEPENSVTINKIFDDGWASGTIADGPNGPSTGFFPLVVVTATGQDSAYDAASSVSGYTARSSSAGPLSFNSAASHLMGSEGNLHDPALADTASKRTKKG